MICPPARMFVSVQFENLLFTRSYSLPAHLITQVSSTEVGCIQLSTGTVQRQFSVACVQRSEVGTGKPGPDDWTYVAKLLSDSRTLTASPAGQLYCHRGHLAVLGLGFGLNVSLLG